MMKTSMRNAVTIHTNDGDEASTFLKPFSDEYDSSLFVVSESAYGDISGYLTNYKDIIVGFHLSVDEFKQLLLLLNIKENEITKNYERFCK